MRTAAIQRKARWIPGRRVAVQLPVACVSPCGRAVAWVVPIPKAPLPVPSSRIVGREQRLSGRLTTRVRAAFIYVTTDETSFHSAKRGLKAVGQSPEQTPERKQAIR
ncbi:hypothetical protein GCM10009827_002450 [Dactylosporangium maewongense]|uniref:Transposase n=1 Tax=Dactylosporangium maewongense TaxID=634393 RepID=A0ABN1ZI60_9ACTN